ncbi:sugar phosphate isomerase/epimerase family protein [Schlesneria paludicola]|uniref:sugar phosphate isomerase/epimerase family protein n=1 Tax=Schlesneria paludicola TaxID=360056 RepID=UPI0012F857AF|nr:sugar phosphate isomerase/epimerase family protein [Schlesneria paludicola]
MQHCLFSVSYAGFWGQASLDLPQFIRRAAQLGYSNVMLAGKRPQLSILDTDERQLELLVETLDNAGVACPVIAAYIDLGHAGAVEVPFLEMQIAYVESLCRIGARLGANVVRVFTAYESDQLPFQGLWQRTVTAIQEMADRAQSFGVTIAVQNHHDLAVHTTALLELLQDIDRSNCRLGFDAWSPALRGEDLYEAARIAAPHTVITTNADYVRLPRFRYCPAHVNYQPAAPEYMRAVPFGAGCIDYARFFRGLHDGGFNGVASYEMCSPLRGGGSLENLDECARQYLRWMNEHKLD